jgi:hypothetical protein
MNKKTGARTMKKKRKPGEFLVRPSGSMCSEFLSQLNDYIDGTANPSICRDLEKHLSGCNPCKVVVDNIRKTITLYRNGEPCDLPVRFRTRLHALVRKQWKKERGS